MACEQRKKNCKKSPLKKNSHKSLFGRKLKMWVWKTKQFCQKKWHLEFVGWKSSGPIMFNLQIRIQTGQVILMTR